MIVLETVEKKLGQNSEGKDVLQVSLNADTSDEVIENGTDVTNIEGMPQNSVLAPFSSCFTATKKLGVLKSDGTWNF